MSTLLEQIRERRSANTEQTLMMMDMVPLSDTETKYSLLSSASLYLNDSRIIEKWIDLIEQETDTQLKADLLFRLSAVGLQQIPDKTRFISLLAAALQQDESRDIILPMLGRFAIHDKEARQALIAFYKQQDNADTSRLILSWLLIPVDTSAEDLAFYLSIMDKVDETDKLLIVNRLLLQDQLNLEQIGKLLVPTEPLSIKEMVLRFCFDRSIVPVDALSALILSDQHAHIRIWSIQLLAVHGINTVDLTSSILHALSKDPDAGVRQAALKVFEYSVTLKPDIISFLQTQIAAEKDTAVTLQLLYLLEPYTAQSEALVTSLFSLLEKGVRTDVAVRIYEILGKLVPQRLPLFEKFLTAYEKEQTDACKAVILKAITSAVTFGNELNSFYLKALEAPSTIIKEWGIQGILQIPLTRENTDVVTAAAPVLLHTELNRELRRLLARKISCIPQLPAAAVQVFTKLLDHDSDTTIKDIAGKIQETAIAQGGGDQINWEQWLHKADVEHDLTGIFPHLWMFYGDNPKIAGDILWSAINPANSGTLYQQGVTDVEILRFLSVKQGGNDNLSRYALDKLLNADLGNESKFKFYLLVLKSNPSFSELKEGLWILLEKRYRYLNLILLEQINQLIWGEQLQAVFTQRIQQQNTAAGVIPYINYLSVNCSWGPAQELLQLIVKIPFVREDNEGSAALKDASRKCGLDYDELVRVHAAQTAATPDAGPGFAD